LEEYKKHPIPEISETCEVAVDLIKFNQEAKYASTTLPFQMHSSIMIYCFFVNSCREKMNAATGGYMSVDPAPPMETDDVVVVENGEEKKKKKKLTIPELKERLRDRNLSIFQRYRALFALRNIGNGEAVEAIASAFDDPSALFRHELAYVMGQIQSSVAVPALIKVLKDDSQHDMVRHEAAEALGSIADQDSLPLLQQYKDDTVPVVKESCQVALDLHEFYNSDSFQYADGLQATH
jgi:deoxyhypusine monooxygenase